MAGLRIFRYLRQLFDVDLTGIQDGDTLVYDSGTQTFGPGPGGGGGAPTDATYITQTANGTLSNEQALSSLATGVVKVTTTTGVLSTATEGTDYYKPGGTDVAIADGGTGASSASAARTNLGLVPGTDVEVHDADLTTIAGLSPTNDDFLQRKAGNWANRTVAQVLTDLAAAGTTFQPLDATLTALAAANWAANNLPIGTGADTLSQTSFAANTFPARASSGNLVAKTISDFGLSLVDDANAATARTTLGIAGAVGGTEWTTVTKTLDESVSNSTAVQADDELFWTPVSGGVYEFELVIVYVSTAGAGTPDLRNAFGEDTTGRGELWAMFWDSGDTQTSGQVKAANDQVFLAGTAATNRIWLGKGWYVGSGAQAGYYWAQGTSGGNATTVKAGSVLRYRRIA